MMTRTTLAIAVALQFLAAPVMAQATSDKDKDMNGHHYQGGPQTGVPHHMTKHPKSNTNANARATSGGHHYEGGPKTESHHMGEK